MIMCEKWLGLKSGSLRARDKQPAVNKVQITIRNAYIYFKHGMRNCPFVKLEHFLISLFTLFSLCDLANILRISPFSKTVNRRPVISSHAAFEFAQTKTQFFDDRTISSIAPTNVRVLPVPGTKTYGIAYM